MGNTKLKDLYCVVNNTTNKDISIGDIILINNCGMATKLKTHESNSDIGYLISPADIANQAFINDFFKLRKDEVIPGYSHTALLCNLNDLQEITMVPEVHGEVVYTYKNIILVYFGCYADIRQEVIDTVKVRCDEIQPIAVLPDEDSCILRADDSIYEKCSITSGNVNTEESEEKSNMNNLFGNLGFGKLRGDRFKLSMNGIAVRQANSDKYVVYNKDKNEFVDVTNTLFDIKDGLFVLPAIEVNIGDTILHEGKPYFIVNTTNEIKAVSYDDCTQTVLIPKSTMFGIKYFSKIFSMFGDNFATSKDLFSNPIMLMSLINGEGNDFSKILLLNSMSQGDLGSNPIALAMMLKGDNTDDNLSTIAMMSMFNNGTNPFAPKKAEKNKEN